MVALNWHEWIGSIAGQFNRENGSPNLSAGQFDREKGSPELSAGQFSP